MQKGLIHIYTGDGKGKTTAATGLAVRACGSGRKVYIVSFLKTSQSGEVNFINSLNCDNIKVFRFEHDHGFVRDNCNDGICDDTKTALEFIFDVLSGKKCDVLILDEIICSYNLGYVTKEDIQNIINIKSDECELILTGRGAPGWLCEKADYVTEMKAIKHPYNSGIDARKGIEF